MTRVLLLQQPPPRPEGMAGFITPVTVSTSVLVAGHSAAICNTLAPEQPEHSPPP